MDAVGDLVTLSDADDPRLDLYRDLNDPAGRARLEWETAVFVVEGKLGVARLIDSPYEILSLLVDDHQRDGAAELVEGVLRRGSPVYVASRAVVADTVGFSLHRGVVAVAARPAPTPVQEVVDATLAGTGLPTVAVLEGLNDHENIGALFRNAAAFGLGGVLLDPSCADPLYRRSVRVSMGHVLHVPTARMTPWPESMVALGTAGFLVVGLAPNAKRPGARVVDVADLARVWREAGRRGIALVLGAEGPGLSDAALASVDLVATIPMAEGVDSLNVATAAAVAFHAVRHT